MINDNQTGSPARNIIMKITDTKIIIGANIIWIFIIFILCALPGDSIPNPQLKIPNLDKIVHFGMFFILSVLLTYPLEKCTSLSKIKIYMIIIGTTIVYGGIIEILQYNFFNRSGDVWDLLADVTGGIAGCPCYPFIKRILFRYLVKK